MSTDDFLRGGVGPHPSRAHWFSEVNNLGDLLSPVVFEHFLGVRPVWCGPEESPKWLGIGSILERARPGDWVWGTGTKYGVDIDVRGLNVLAVRGPRTATLMKNLRSDIAFGDPALLLPMIYRPPVAEGRPESVGFIPHYVDRDFIPRVNKEAVTIDITNPNWMETVDLITRCSVVISSSLHGIIVSEAYGVPAVWVQPSDRILGGHHKFQDYYSASGREGRCQPWQNNVFSLQSAAEEPPDFSGQQEGLIDSLRHAIESTT